MESSKAALISDYLLHYNTDLKSRWSEEALRFQANFVTSRLPKNGIWDWSAPAITLQLLQARLLSEKTAPPPGTSLILAAGPLMELLSPSAIVEEAARSLKQNGRLIAIIPCLRDNSPENEFFAMHASENLWPYYTAEYWQETMQEGGFMTIDPPQFKENREFSMAQIEGRMNFRGFMPLIEKLQNEGYDPIEIAWGDLHLNLVKSNG
jgi:hypothetical protein